MTPVLRAKIAAAALTVFTALAGSSALAFFSGGGVGTAAAGVTSFGKSTITSATPATGGSVTLNWSAVSGPNTETPVTYYVSRDGAPAAGTCPTKSAPASVTTCVDKNVEPGTHTYVVTALWRSWTSETSPVNANVTVGGATQLSLSAAGTNLTAGESDNLTITALDSTGATVSTYTGSHNLVFSGASASPSGATATVANSSGTAIAFGAATAINFTNGVATVSSGQNGVMKIYRAKSAEIGVTDGNISDPTPLAVNVAPAALSKFNLGAETVSPAAGAADNLTISAQDTYGNVVTSFAGSKSLTFSGASASPNGNAPTVANSSGTAVTFGTATPISFSAGVATGSAGANGELRLYKSGTSNLTVTEGPTSSAPVAITVSPLAASKFLLGGSVLSLTAGGSSNLTTTALDAYGNTATSYAGSHTLTFSGASASPGGTAPTVTNTSGTAIAFGAATAIAFTSGVATVSSTQNGVMTLYKVVPTTVVVSDGSITNGSGLAFTVTPSTANKFVFTNLVASRGTVGSPCLATCTVTGIGLSGTIKANVAVADTYGNPVSNLGTGHTAAVTASTGTVSGGSLAIPSTGAAESTSQFTFTSPSSGNFTATIKAAASAGTAYTNSTITATK